MQRLGLLVVLATLASCDCSHGGVTGVTGSLRLAPLELDFGTVYPDGVTRTQTLDALNDGRKTVSVKWSLPQAPFSAETVAEIPTGTTPVPVHFTPTVAGTFDSTLMAIADGAETGVSIRLKATVLPVPECPSDNPCVTTHFDMSQGRCVEDAVDDGTACELQGSLCVVNARCEAGRCVGSARNCNDDDACTTDVCYPLTGCEHIPAPPCPGDGACMKGVCDSQTGCGLAPRDDGESCGSTGESNSCTAVKVCIEGACVTRDPPDGYICAEASPCGSIGRCVNDVCVRASETTLSPSWSYDSYAVPTPDAGTLRTYLHDFVMEPSGDVSLTGWFGYPSLLRANTSNAMFAPEGSSRRCIMWNSRFVCADYPINPSGQISAIDLGTGNTEWTFSIQDSEPAIAQSVQNIFLARLVVQGPDRLAAVYEAYPANSGNATQCRAYFLVVIDANGQPVQAQAISDPLLDNCNHPHPYGVAADAQGNLFIAFSPTLSPQAPLVPDNTTLIMSWSRDGVFRWKRTNTGMRGGELAVARGLLYAEYTGDVVDATSGVPRFTLNQLLGRAVVSSSRLVPAPVKGGLGFRGFEAASSAPRWEVVLPGNWAFWSDQIRLAKWQTSKGARTVALTWLEDVSSGLQPTYALYGVDVEDGSQAFLCPLNPPTTRTEPQLFEVANGSLGLMNGSVDDFNTAGCVKCDPPLASSSAMFSTFATPTLSIPVAPWPGTFGGAGHDHQEN